MKKIDWTAPLEGIHPAVGAIVYLGVQAVRDGAKITDDFKHLVLLGDKRRASYVDDYGRVPRGGSSGQPILRNVGAEEEEEEVTPPTAASAVNHTSALLFASAVDRAVKAIAGYATAVDRYTEAIGKMQTQSFDASVMLVEEVRKLHAVAALPAITTAIPTAKTASPMRAAAPPPDPAPVADSSSKITSLNKITSRSAQSRLKALAAHDSVRSIVVGAVRGSTGDRHIEGYMVAGGMIGDAGFNSTLYGRGESYDVQVYVTDAARVATQRAGLALADLLK